VADCCASASHCDFQRSPILRRPGATAWTIKNHSTPAAAWLTGIARSFWLTGEATQASLLGSAPGLPVVSVPLARFVCVFPGLAKYHKRYGV